MNENSRPDQRTYRICGIGGWLSYKGQFTPDVTKSLPFKSRAEAVKQIELLKKLFEELLHQTLFVATFLKSDLEKGNTYPIVCA